MRDNSYSLIRNKAGYTAIQFGKKVDLFDWKEHCMKPRPASCIASGCSPCVGVCCIASHTSTGNCTWEHVLANKCSILLWLNSIPSDITYLKGAIVSVEVHAYRYIRIHEALLLCSSEWWRGFPNDALLVPSMVPLCIVLTIYLRGVGSFSFLGRVTFTSELRRAS